VGWIASGEWLEYSVEVAAAGTYDVAIRVARKPSGSGALHLEAGGIDLTGSLTVPSTGGWQAWTTITAQVDLAAGPQVLRLAMDASKFNVNWVEFVSATTVNQAPTAAIDANPLSGPAPLLVDFSAAGSSDADGSIVAYTWDFGDGATGTGAAPSHTYQSAGSYTATLTVSDDGGASDSASVAITVEASTGSGVVAAINAGGGAFTAGDGTAYSADSANGGKVYSTTSAIAGTSDNALYQSERYGDFGYDLPLADGDYVLTLQFAEIYWSADGKRLFDVLVEGQLAVDDLDIHAQVGKNVVYDVVVPVTVSDGQLDIDFVTITDNAKLSALIVEAVTGGNG